MCGAKSCSLAIIEKSEPQSFKGISMKDRGSDLF